MAKHWRVLGAVASLALLSLDAGAGGHRISKVALEGDPAPDTGGATFASVDVFSLDLGASGHVAYGGSLSTPLPNWGVFVHAGGSGSARALSGDAAPLPLGGTYVAFGRPHVDAVGDVSMGAIVRLPSSASANALVLATVAGDSILASELDAAPGGGTFVVGVGDLSFHAREAGGLAVFQSDVLGGAEGVFAGTSSAVARVGDASPAGGTYASFDWPGANAAGVVAFPSTLSGASANAGLFVAAGSGASAIALEGGIAPQGETFYEFALPIVNAGGDVLFVAGWPPDGNDGAIYVSDAGGLRSVARSGQILPETGGGAIAGLGGTPDFADDGSVSFSAVLTGGSVGSGVFVADASGAIQAVALAGAPVPGAPEDSFESFSSTSIDGAGQVAFGATTTGGLNGVFLAGLAGTDVPSLSWPALLVLLGLLALSAAPALHRRSSVL